MVVITYQIVQIFEKEILFFWCNNSNVSIVFLASCTGCIKPSVCKFSLNKNKHLYSYFNTCMYISRLINLDICYELILEICHIVIHESIHCKKHSTHKYWHSLKRYFEIPMYKIGQLNHEGTIYCDWKFQLHSNNDFNI